MVEFPDRTDRLDLDAVLSHTDLVLARLISCGLSNAVIASRLHRSCAGIRAQTSKLLRRTGARSRTQLVVWMYETGHVIPGIAANPDGPRSPQPGSGRALSPEQATAMSLPALRRQLTTTRNDLATLARVLERPRVPRLPSATPPAKHGKFRP
ncbi:DNA-binding CsgD family transcriptional regulator [Saccharopolyspora gloriosae]|uniref:DNA-binding CsgD family transcriptional regulator n=1 Tax=Saccharopolyspora gloriosae TaxID=455344 RepID=A0A840NDR9_9PSEU|nr:LuxR C-terminal-related transcriptional regulator [Saccharopolyspora gloriosae]MBB5070070.1 DNA-binding CsgD family transcriptional regulator [Saccharopolyspora gloriosae]